MKKTIFILLLTLMIGHSYAQESESFENHASRLYVSIGTGIPVLNMGGGFSYTYEIGKVDSTSFLGVSLDTQLGISGTTGIYFNTQMSFGAGYRYKSGARFYFDILGLGFGLTHERDTVIDNSSSTVYSVMATATGVLINFMGFHHTTSNGFYFSWRNNLTLFTNIYGKSIDNLGNTIAINISGGGLEYRTYFTFGFDFSRKYNPRAYQKREY